MILPTNVELGTTYFRQLVDAVPTDVQDNAVDLTCNVEEDGSIPCTFED